MTITVRLSAVLSRFAVDPTQGPADVANSTETLIDALEQAAVEPLIDAISISQVSNGYEKLEE